MDSDSIQREAYSYLDVQNVSYLATSTQSQPYVRAMMLIYIDERLYYATGAEENKVAQIKTNPNVEVCMLIGEDEDGGSIRLRGKADFVENLEIKKRVFECVPFIQNFWTSYDNPDYRLIEIIPSYLEYMKPETMKIHKTKI